MSQAKVEQYKKEKANRWAGFSGYNYYESKKPAKTYHVSTTDLDNYLSTLTSDSE